MAGTVRTKPVKIAVIGDEKAGKTSLVVAAANESFPDVCPPVVPPAILPAECTPEGVPLHIIDTSSKPEERTVLEQTCLNADVIVLLFDSARPQSLKRIGSYWMPELRRLGVHVPVILVGTKVDKNKQDIAALAQPVMKQYREIESCLECSAKHLIHVVEVFYFALKAVIYPVAPLFDPRAENGMGALRPLCVRALKRVFLMNDQDKDGALNDKELNAFQVSCFQAPLQPEELTGVRRVVSEAMPQGVSSTGLTLPGFLFLHALFIERGRLETVWAVLRKYGYNDNLVLSQEVLSEVNFSRAPDQVVELTEAGRNFFSEKFVEYDKDGDKLLSSAEQAEMFSTAPTGPWKGEEYRGLWVEAAGDGGDAGTLTLPGFLAKWAFTTAHDPVRSLAYARYLGYDGPAAQLFAISRSRRSERRAEHLQRTVLQVHVFLSQEAGKGLLLSSLTGRPAEAAQGASASVAAGEVKADSASISQGGAGSYTLIVSEQDRNRVETFERDPDQLIKADVAAFTFDSGSLASLREAQEMLLRVAHASNHTLPCVLVAIDDRGGMTQEVLSECGAVCAELELRQPYGVNRESPGDVPALFQGLILAAAKPDKALALPQTAALKAMKQYQRLLRTGLLYLAGGAAGGLACYAIYKAFRRSSSSDSGSSSSAAAIEPSQAAK